MCNDTLIKIFQNRLHLNFLGFHEEDAQAFIKSIPKTYIPCRSLIQMIYADSSLKHFEIIIHANRVLKI